MRCERIACLGWEEGGGERSGGRQAAMAGRGLATGPAHQQFGVPPACLLPAAEGWNVPEAVSTVPIPGYNMPQNADYRTI